MTNPLKVAGYWRLLSGSFIATTALWIQRIALSFLVWKLSGSAFWTTAVAAAQFAPSAFLGPLFGVVVDRIALRRLDKPSAGHIDTGIQRQRYYLLRGCRRPLGLCPYRRLDWSWHSLLRPNPLGPADGDRAQISPPHGHRFFRNKFQLNARFGAVSGCNQHHAVWRWKHAGHRSRRLCCFWPITLTLTLKQRQLPAKAERPGLLARISPRYSLHP